MNRKKIYLSLVSTLISLSITGCGNSGTQGDDIPNKTQMLHGAATDDYIIDGDVKIYDKNGKLVSKKCETGDFGQFTCELTGVNENDKLVVIVEGGKLDTDGNASTLVDTKDFSGKSLIATAELGKGVIVSPITTKLMVGAKITVDTDENLSYLNTQFDLSSIKDKNLTQILINEKNSLIPTIIKANNKETIREQVRKAKKLLANNILIVNDVKEGNNQNFRVHILHVNDTHSHIEPERISVKFDGVKTYVYTGGYAKIAKYFNDTKEADSHTLNLHAGDAVQGTLYYNLFGGKVGVACLNKMQIDAQVLGNHAFDRGADNLRDNFVSKVNYPILSANTIVSDENEGLKKLIKPYIIKDVNGQKIAILGLTVESAKLSSPGPTISFANAIDTAKTTVQEIETKGINKIIALSHLGYDRDKILAQEVPDIDVVVGGHSHTLLGNFSNIGLTSKGNYPTVIKHNESQTLVLQAWKWGMVVGDINVIFDKDGKIKKYLGTPVMLLSDKFLRKDADGHKVEVNATVKSEIKKIISKLSNVKIEEPEADIEDIISQYKPQVDKMMKKTIGEATANLIHTRIPGAIDPDNGKVLPNGSLIAPLVVKAMYEKAKEYGGADFAMQNAGGIRISIPEGNVTMGEVMQMLPFGNTLTTLDMQGSDIKDMIESAIDRSYIKGTNTGCFPYLANAKFTFNPKKPEGQRIVEFKVKKDGKWEDLDPNKTYTIATNSYIANGGDNYIEFEEKATNKYDTGFVYANIFIDYIKQVKTLSPLPIDEVPVSVIKYNLPKVNQNVAMNDINVSLGSVTFPNGKVLNANWGFGSAAAHKYGDDANTFYTLTDRGVNIKCKDAKDIIGLDYKKMCKGDKDGKIFPFPSFTPTIVKWEKDGTNLVVKQVTPLRDKDGYRISGVSNPLSNFPEKAYDKNGTLMSYDPNGLDTEALYVKKDGTFWIGEEYAPSLVELDKNGKIIRRLVPNGLEQNLSKANYKVEGVLPSIIAKRHPNRGIEAIALSPDEKYIYFMIQSPLDNPDYRDTNVTRLYKMQISNPSNIELYAYEEDPADSFKYDNKTKQSKVKISEMSCLGDNTLLIDERVTHTTKLYKVDLSKGTPVPTDKVDTIETDMSGVTPLKKTLLATQSSPKKIEGVANLDGTHFLLINDNDFGIENDPEVAKVVELNSSK